MMSAREDDNNVREKLSRVANVIDFAAPMLKLVGEFGFNLSEVQLLADQLFYSVHRRRRSDEEKILS